MKKNGRKQIILPFFRYNFAHAVLIMSSVSAKISFTIFVSFLFSSLLFDAWLNWSSGEINASEKINPSDSKWNFLFNIRDNIHNRKIEIMNWNKNNKYYGCQLK